MSQPVNYPLGPGCFKKVWGQEKPEAYGAPLQHPFKPLQLGFACLEKNVSILTRVPCVSSDKRVTVLVVYCSPHSPAQRGWGPVDCNILLLPNNGTV